MGQCNQVAAMGQSVTRGTTTATIQNSLNFSAQHPIAGLGTKPIVTQAVSKLLAIAYPRLHECNFCWAEYRVASSSPTAVSAGARSLRQTHTASNSILEFYFYLFFIIVAARASAAIRASDTG
jgi:hypothetical protein